VSNKVEEVIVIVAMVLSKSKVCSFQLLSFDLRFKFHYFPNTHCTLSRYTGEVFLVCDVARGNKYDEGQEMTHKLKNNTTNLDCLSSPKHS